VRFEQGRYDLEGALAHVLAGHAHVPESLELGQHLEAQLGGPLGLATTTAAAPSLRLEALRPR
jgi:hypothetical protein